MNAEDIARIGKELAEKGTDEAARRLRKEVRPLRGVRGVPAGAVARVADAAFRACKPELPRDRSVLTRLFSVAWEDGLVAIALLAACTADAPEAAWDIASDWMTRIDDVQTADALGWHVVGPALLGGGIDVEPAVGLAALISECKSLPRPVGRRIAVAAGLAFLPEKITGPTAAALRARYGEADPGAAPDASPVARNIAFVEAPYNGGVHGIATAFLRDESPEVRKAMRRLIRCWVAADPDAAVAWASAQKGGLPVILREELPARRAT